MQKKEERLVQYSIMGNNTDEQEWIEQPGGWGNDPKKKQAGGGGGGRL